MIDFITTHKSALLEAVSAAIALGAAVSAITPTRTDNKIVRTIKKIADVLGLNVGHAKNGS